MATFSAAERTPVLTDTVRTCAIAGSCLMFGGWLVYATGTGCSWKLRKLAAGAGAVLVTVGMMEMLSLSRVPWF